MTQVATVFKNGGSQAVRLPAAFRFDTDRVYVRRDELGDVVLSTRPGTWDAFIEVVTGLDVPDDFLNTADRQEPERDVFGDVA